MKKYLIAAAILAVGANVASAQTWSKDSHPYAKKYHSACQDKARQLHGYEIRAKADGKLTKRERDTMRSLERDLDRTCGRFRWKG